MRRIILILACVVALAGFTVLGQDTREQSSDGPAVGQTAPDFGLPWATAEGYHFNKNDWIKLSEQRGHNVILAFYAADWSPG
jgi:hypothetical protein